LFGSENNAGWNDSVGGVPRWVVAGFVFVGASLKQPHIMSHGRFGAYWQEHNHYGRSAIDAKRAKAAGDLTEFSMPIRIRFVRICE
jgi:hypothetical protein